MGVFPINSVTLSAMPLGFCRPFEDASAGVSTAALAGRPLGRALAVGQGACSGR